MQITEFLPLQKFKDSPGLHNKIPSHPHLLSHLHHEEAYHIN